MTTKESLTKQSELIAAKLIQAIKQDELITSSGSLSSQAIRDNLPAICHTIIKAIAENNPNLLGISKSDRGSQHGITRSTQEFDPEEINREFFLLKQIVLTELKPQLLRSSPLKHIQQVLHQGRNVLRLLDDTLKLSSYQKGNFKLRIGSIDVCTLLEDIILGLKPNIEAKNLRVITSCVPQRLIIKSDALRLQ